MNLKISIILYDFIDMVGLWICKDFTDLLAFNEVLMLWEHLIRAISGSLKTSLEDGRRRA